MTRADAPPHGARRKQTATYRFRKAGGHYPESDWLRSLPASVLYMIAVAGGVIVVGLTLLVLTLTFAAAVRL